MATETKANHMLRIKLDVDVWHREPIRGGIPAWCGSDGSTRALLAQLAAICNETVEAIDRQDRGESIDDAQRLLLLKRWTFSVVPRKSPDTVRNTTKAADRRAAKRGARR